MLQLWCLFLFVRDCLPQSFLNTVGVHWDCWSLCTRDMRWEEAAEELGGDCAADSHGSFAAHYSTLANLDLLLWKRGIHWHLCLTTPNTDLTCRIREYELEEPQTAPQSQLRQYLFNMSSCEWEKLQYGTSDGFNCRMKWTSGNWQLTATMMGKQRKMGVTKSKLRTPLLELYNGLFQPK